MTDEIAFPPLHDPAPDELERRKRHLLSEIRRPSVARARTRIAVLAGAAVALAAGAAIVSMVQGGGSVAEAATLVVQTSSGKTVSLPAGSPTAATTEIAGGTESDQALMRTIVAGMQPTVIEKIEMVRSGDDVALHFTFTARSSQALWEDWLVAAAFRDRSEAAGEHVSVSVYDGDAVGASPPPGQTVPPERPGDTAAGRRLFEAAASQAGVSFSSLTIYHPDGVAVAATFTSDDPASFLVHQMPAFLAALRPQDKFDGTYISLVDGSGQTVWQAFWSFRSSQGGAGASTPALAACSPVANWGPSELGVGQASPQCPASG
jgi:hypothetical protein